MFLNDTTIKNIIDFFKFGKEQTYKTTCVT